MHTYDIIVYSYITLVVDFNLHSAWFYVVKHGINFLYDNLRKLYISGIFVLDVHTW